MKKIFFFLVLSVTLFSCSKDADETQNFTVHLNVDRFNNIGNNNASTRAFLSDENGTILDSGDLKKGQLTTLSFSKDPSAHFDLSYMRYDIDNDLGIELYSLVTFTNIEAGTYYLSQSLFCENSQDEITLKLNNTGYPLEVISTPTLEGDGGPQNGGYFNFSSNLIGSPTSDFYVSFKSPNDQFVRYYWGESIPEGSVFNIDYNTLPEITNPVNTQIPSNSFSFFSVEGLKNNDISNIHHSIAYGNFAGGNTSLSTSAPPNVFDNYIFNVYYHNNNIEYSKQLLTNNIPEGINTPAFDFTINNPSPQNFNMSTTGEATIYKVGFKAENSNGRDFLFHNIYGEVTSEVSFSKENLRMNIQQSYQDLTGFETLSLDTASLVYYNLTNAYKDILKFEITGKRYEIPAVNGFIDSFSKRFE
jgi:hypothetical protein